ncbi:AraC family transcriptional regulator [Robiginitalea sp. SC105]|uniref:helix-turn-helix domain-containing protein n=1 Tax=Robiginitalea sp. SC105 TaxID=2762332 RepID=UPI00163B6158|nr:helix-turn-helix transcriptional regulator [Robiginitalea sp. SC105]MBC2837869.1 helix-turn-helix transcriptional regulator [Robiginitalea sp. SC105]
MTASVQPSDLSQLIAAIPIRHDLVSYLMFSGVLLGFLLSGVIWLRGPRENRALFYFALLICCLSVTNLDTFLCYTGWMKYTLAWNDSTEPLTLLFAPLLYLSIRHLVIKKPLPPGILFLHFLPAIGYGLSQIGYYTEPLPVKFNAYKDAYFSHIPFAEVPEGTSYGYQWIKDKQRWLLLIGFTFYGLLSVRLWQRSRKDFRDPASGVRISKYRFGRFALVTFLLSLGLMLLVYLNYEDDGGDHYLSLFTFAVTLSSTIAFLTETRFFQRSWLLDKYETSASRGGDITLEQLREAAGRESFFTSPEASLKSLANHFDIHPNLVSRLINEETSGNFNDFINGFRVDLAKSQLRSGKFRHLTIEAIGRNVGFRSRSSFYEAFRKQTGHSPSQFMKSAGKS